MENIAQLIVMWVCKNVFHFDVICDLLVAQIEDKMHDLISRLMLLVNDNVHFVTLKHRICYQLPSEN